MLALTLLAATVPGQCPTGYYPPPVCYSPPVTYCQPYYEPPVRYYPPARTYQPQYATYTPQYNYSPPRRPIRVEEDDDYAPAPKTAELPRIGIRESYTPRVGERQGPAPLPRRYEDDDEEYIPPAKRTPVRETQPQKKNLPDGYLRRPSDIPDRR